MVENLGTIFNITNKNIYVQEGKSYYKISKDLFVFKPQIGMCLKVLKKSDGSILKIIPMKEKERINSKERRYGFLRFTTVHTMLLGMLLLLLISEHIHHGENYFVPIVFLSLLMCVSSVTNLFRKNKKAHFRFFVFTTILYVLFAIIGIMLLIKNMIAQGAFVLIVSAFPLFFNFMFYNLKPKPDIAISKPFTEET